ncbi:ShlB/FhaC/HecB family hemolysin secretion/activation protein [Proteus mirabilis]|uniref:ShlB/FhaC/HecB family hemolysin secretion/activation protein n=1 Tax=Proteus mirabilis TaxID=584 RepID=UPI001262A09E|nr:ShlB/FhaC/HecB family hemolysin secretion/activation protein [Proteus mirabilis]KAB7715180.1 ShlB/FhaC/HecB family hemolysin secretion/activation protein [Proteus mirabilis]
MNNIKRECINYLLGLMALFLLTISKITFAEINNNVNNCFLINEIKIERNGLLTNKAQKELISKYINKCLTLSDMQHIIKSMTNAYIEKGYITSQAFIADQDLSNHQLTINVIEGKIKSIFIDNMTSPMVDILFPSYQDKRLNLRELEHGLEQLNRLTTSQYRLDIQPSDRIGYSTIFIYKKNKKHPFRNQLTIDNSGSKATGEILLTNTTTIDSLFGFGEQWDLSLNSNTDLLHSHYYRGYTASINIPYGYWFYQYQLSYNRSSHFIKSYSNQYIYKSINTNQQVDISRLLYRDSKKKIILKGILKHKKVRTELAKQPILINSPTLTSLSLAPQYHFNLTSGYLSINPSAEIGLSFFGASPDYIAENSPRSHYRKLSLNIHYQYLFPYSVSYITSFYGQYTSDNLYSVEKITIDGLNAVRGAKQNKLSANRGLYWRNEINTPWINSFLGQWRFITAVDYGVIYSDQYETKQQSLLAGAMGLSFYRSPFSSQLLINKPFIYPKWSNANQWSLSWSISFAL